MCPNTVARLLKELGFRLRVNHKKLPGRADPGRDAQFAYITAQREHFAAKGLPIISVDAKHRELVGNFANRGRAWSQRARRRQRPTTSPPTPTASPSPTASTTWPPTPARCSSAPPTTPPPSPPTTIARWWVYHGRRRYPAPPNCSSSPTAAAATGPEPGPGNTPSSNGSATATASPSPSATIPTGASKYNPVEHRLFSEISKNWAGRPLDSYETILNYIRTTTTTTGLEVKAYLVTTDYPTGVKITDEEMAQLQTPPPRHPARPQLHPQPPHSRLIKIRTYCCAIPKRHIRNDGPDHSNQLTLCLRLAKSRSLITTSGDCASPKVAAILQ